MEQAQPSEARVAPDTALTVGRSYRITEIAAHDDYPAHKVGDVVTCLLDPHEAGVEMAPDSIDAESEDGYWFAAAPAADSERHDRRYGTYVTGLEVVS